MSQAIPVETYFCPSRRSPQNINDPAGVYQAAAIDYAANGGHLSFVNPATGDAYYGRNTPMPFPYTTCEAQHSGVVGAGLSIMGEQPIDPPLRPTDIHDGLSNTIVVGEKRLNSSLNTSGTFTISQPGDVVGFVAGFNIETIRTGAVPPKVDESDPNQLVYDGFGSAHPNGFHALFADTSVRTISYHVSSKPTMNLQAGQLTVMQMLCHRDDGGHFALDD